VVHEKKIFENVLNKFIILRPKRGQPLYLNKSEFPSPSMFPIKFGWNWLSCCWEEVD